jgi:hypothetical protein
LEFKKANYTFLFDPLMTQKNPYQGMFATLVTRAVFVCAISPLYAPKKAIFLTKFALYFLQSMGILNGNY